MTYPQYIKPPRQYFGAGSSAKQVEPKKADARKPEVAQEYDLVNHAVIMSTLNY